MTRRTPVALTQRRALRGMGDELPEVPGLISSSKGAGEAAPALLAAALTTASAAVELCARAAGLAPTAAGSLEHALAQAGMVSQLVAKVNEATTSDTTTNGTKVNETSEGDEAVNA